MGWFTAHYDYSGSGDAVFEAPHAELRGPTSVTADERGRPVVEMLVEQSTPPLATQFDLLALEFGSQPIPGGHAVAVGIGSSNRVRAIVRGTEGIFECGPDWNYCLAFPQDGQLTLRITPMKSEFKAVGAGPETLLVLPLSGFNPRMPGLTSDMSAEPVCLSALSGSDHGTCVLFTVSEMPASIQLFLAPKVLGPEVELTALGVFSFIDPEMLNPWGWFLTTFLRVLELATGVEVGMPWIETRDEHARLIRRLHFSVGSARATSRGYSALPTAWHWAGGEYMTAFLSAAESREPFFRIALRHLIRAGLDGITLDDQLDHLVRALECLCLRYGYSTQDLTAGLDPDVANQDRAQTCKIGNHDNCWRGNASQPPGSDLEDCRKSS